MTIKTPIVFFIFRRPELTEQVFEYIRQSQPSTLFVVADGPRLHRPEDSELCEKTRNIIKQVDWKCKVLTDFSDVNLGCKNRIVSGLNWVFSQVDEAIILEDDCLPSASFFPFCETMLEYYRHDQRTMMISGTNSGLIPPDYPYSYYGSSLARVWGWATWKRAWSHFDLAMEHWPEFKKLGLIDTFCNDEFYKNYWIDELDKVYSGALDSWSYIWMYSYWKQHGLSIVPKYNLVSNLGFGVDSTHTSYLSGLENLPTQEISTIHHPPFLLEYRKMDYLHFDNYLGGRSIRRNLLKIKTAALELLELIKAKSVTRVAI
jgi:hypothetical protein